MAVYISSLTPGQELLCWVKVGLALTVAQRGDSSVYGTIPRKSQAKRPGDLSKFIGFVLRNDPVNKVITLQISQVSHKQLPFPPGFIPNLVADISYTAFRRVRLYSAINFEPKPGNKTFPANFPDGEFRPYRTLTPVRLR